jgi:hypothetical protein
VAGTVVGAVVERWLADGQLGSFVPSGLWLEEVPDDLPLPHAVLAHEGEAPADWGSESYLEETRLRFRVYADRDPNQPLTDPARPAEACEAVANAVKRVFDWCVLDVDGAESVKVERVEYRLGEEARRAAGGGRVYRAELVYAVTVEKPR